MSSLLSYFAQAKTTRRVSSVCVCVCANGFGKSKARLVNGAAIEWQDSSNQSVAQARDSRGDRTTGPIDSE